MKTITRTKIYLPMAAMIVTAALALPAAAQTEVPFQGNFQGTDTPTPPTILQSITGNGTLVGLFSSTAVSGGPGLLTAHWIAANGDSIDTTYVGSFAGHWIWPLARLWVRSLKTVMLRSSKITPLLVVRVDSPASKGALS